MNNVFNVCNTKLYFINTSRVHLMDLLELYSENEWCDERGVIGLSVEWEYMVQYYLFTY